MGGLFTIGYANKDVDTFVGMLKANRIDCVVDVRTTPYSKQYPLYNENAIKVSLRESGISYLSFKQEFGARRAEEDAYESVLYPDGSRADVVLFEKVWTLAQFQRGVRRVLNGLEKGLNICLMCSEKHPYECHRDVMVAEYFYRREGITVRHIFDLETTETHTAYDADLERIFQEQKAKFLKDNQMELTYGGGLLAEEYTLRDHVRLWNDFFSQYSREKGYYLQNLLIGYRKGATEND